MWNSNPTKCATLPLFTNRIAEAAMVGMEKDSPAIALANPVYWSIASDDTIRRVIASGVRGSLMPAFAKSAGGTLTDQQIQILVREMRTHWAKVKLSGAPPYAATEPGDSVRGGASYTTFCAGCHGPEGKGTKTGSSIVDDSFLALVSDQALRTTIIAGRPDLGHPDWRNYVSNRTDDPSRSYRPCGLVSRPQKG
jgi:mono/diheme cytochrome c family protein